MDDPAVRLIVIASSGVKDHPPHVGYHEVRNQLAQQALPGVLRLSVANVDVRPNLRRDKRPGDVLLDRVSFALEMQFALAANSEATHQRPGRSEIRRM